MAQKQDSYLKDTTDFLNFIESTKLLKNTVLVSMDVTSLYTNIPHEEGVTTLCYAYEDFYGDKALYRGTQREYSSKPLNIALLNVF